MNGALLINKHAGVTSFSIVESLQRAWMRVEGKKRRDAPKMGHGGTLDPFATGLLIVCVGRGVKLARYFLGSTKEYEGRIRFGETTVPGDPTAPISETSDLLPESREQIQEAATRFTLQPYLQTPPMHSAKKKDGKPLYELAREGIEVEREAKACQLHSFDVLNYAKPHADFRVRCSSGTYIRTLAQDLARALGSVALLETLHRSGSGLFRASNAWTLAQIEEALTAGNKLDELPCWVPFDQMLSSFDRAEATEDERRAIFEGRQNVLFNILKRVEAGSEPQDRIAIYCRNELIAIAVRAPGSTAAEWGLERVFTPQGDNA